jgi:hypothetical protein
MKKFNPISVSDDYFKRIDLSTKKQKIIDFLQTIKNLKINLETVWESRYWGKGIGAFQIEGNFFTKNLWQPVIIKIQGPKPHLSEAKIISLFEKQNQSSIIKTPKVLFYQPWKKSLGSEIIIFEKINAYFIIKPHLPANLNQLKEFFYVYQEYKERALNKSFFKKPSTKNFSYLKLFNQWQKIRHENPFSYLINQKEDRFLKQVAYFLDKVFKNVPLDFQHRHLSVYDIKKASNNNYYLFSNLFWGWGWPLYDIVFGFMWFILGLAEYQISVIKEQINLWEKIIHQTVENTPKILSKFKQKSQFYLHLAFLERYLAALNLDILMTNKKENILKMKPILKKQLKFYYQLALKELGGT